MKAFSIAALIVFSVLFATSVLAANIFMNTPLSELRLVEAEPDADRAIIEDKSGIQETVYTGDRIGTESGTIIRVAKAFIQVRTGNKIIRLSLIYPPVGN